MCLEGKYIEKLVDEEMMEIETQKKKKEMICDE